MINTPINILYSKCKYCIMSYAVGFGDEVPVPTCKRFHNNRVLHDDNLRGTYEKCEDIALENKCILYDKKGNLKRKYKV